MKRQVNQFTSGQMQQSKKMSSIASNFTLAGVIGVAYCTYTITSSKVPGIDAIFIIYGLLQILFALALSYRPNTTEQIIKPFIYTALIVAVYNSFVAIVAIYNIIVFSQVAGLVYSGAQLFVAIAIGLVAYANFSAFRAYKK